MTFLNFSPLDNVLAKVGYRLYKSKDARYCFLPAPNDVFCERVGSLRQYTGLMSKAKACQKGEYGIGVSADTPVVVCGGEHCYKVGGAVVPLADRDKRRG
jgi:hypothetical protein